MNFVADNAAAHATASHALKLRQSVYNFTRHL